MEFGWNLVYIVGVVAVLFIIVFFALLILIIIAGQIKEAWKVHVLNRPAQSLNQKKERHEDA